MFQKCPEKLSLSLSLYYCVGKVKQAFTRIRCLAHNKLPYRLRKLCPNFFEYIGSNLFLSKIIFDFVRAKYRKRILREENLKEWNWRKFLEENFQLNFISIKLFDSLLRLRSNARKHIVQRRLSVQRLISALSPSRTLDLLQGYTLSGEDRHEAFMNLGNHRLDSVDNLANEQSPTSFTTKPIQFWKNHFHRTKGGRDSFHREARFFRNAVRKGKLRITRTKYLRGKEDTVTYNQIYTRKSFVSKLYGIKLFSFDATPPPSS